MEFIILVAISLYPAVVGYGLLGLGKNSEVLKIFSISIYITFLLFLKILFNLEI